MGAQEINIAKLVQNADGKTLLLSRIIPDYQSKYGKRPIHSGKFKDYFESCVDGVEICSSGGSTVAIWVGNNKKTNELQKDDTNSHQERLIVEIIQNLAKSNPKILLSSITNDYKNHERNKSGKKPIYDGKFRYYIVSNIPGVREGGGSTEYDVTWVGGESTSNSTPIPYHSQTTCYLFYTNSSLNYSQWSCLLEQPHGVR